MFNPDYQLGLDTALLKQRDLVRFFDIDGVLSVYAYGADGINAVRDEAFDAFMETHDLYQYAAAPVFIKEYIEQYTTPTLNYVVSQSGTEAQDQQKLAFLKRCWPVPGGPYPVYTERCEGGGCAGSAGKEPSGTRDTASVHR